MLTNHSYAYLIKAPDQKERRCFSGKIIQWFTEPSFWRGFLEDDCHTWPCGLVVVFLVYKYFTHYASVWTTVWTIVLMSGKLCFIAYWSKFHFIPFKWKKDQPGKSSSDMNYWKWRDVFTGQASAWNVGTMEISFRKELSKKTHHGYSSELDL